MKLNKFIVMPLSISLFSTLVLGSVSTQQVKADTGNSDTSIIKSDQIQSNTNNTSNPEKNATAQQEPQPEVKPPTSSDSSQKVTLSFVDNEGNPIVNSVGTPYTISENKNTGDTITSSDLANQIKTDLNDSYTITDSNNNIIVQKDNDKYTIELTPKSYKFAIARNPNDGDSYALNATLTVGKAITAQYGDNGSDSSSAKNVADQTFDGYGFSYLVYGSNGDTIPNTSNGKLKITYDMIPEFTKKYSNSINGYLITAFYKQPLNQTLTLKHVDDLGNEIPNTTDETVTGYKTGNIIVDPYSLATVKNIPGYTYLKVTRPYTVSNNNSINLIYKKMTLII